MKSHGSASKWLRNQNASCWSGRGCQWRIHFEIFRMNILPQRFCGIQNTPQKFGKRNPSCRSINIYIYIHVYSWFTYIHMNMYTYPPGNSHISTPLGTFFKPMIFRSDVHVVPWRVAQWTTCRSPVSTFVRFFPLDSSHREEQTNPNFSTIDWENSTFPLVFLKRGAASYIKEMNVLAKIHFFKNNIFR